MGRGKNISLQKKEEPPVTGYQASWCNCGKYLPPGKTHQHHETQGMLEQAHDNSRKSSVLIEQN